MITWDAAIKKALYMYWKRDQYAYFYGAKGETLTESAMDYFIRTYPDHFKRYTAAQLKDIKAWSAGKIGYDCSGFTGACIGSWKNSTGQFADCVEVSDNLAMGPAGSLLWRPGHISLDIGYGYFLHMPTEGRTIELSKISAYGWEKTGKSILINYEGSDYR